MPLSPLTRLQAAILVIAFATALFWLLPHTLIVMPLLLWLMVSNSVKEASPFDESAFHRTRPVSPVRVFSHLVGFHLVVLFILLAVLLTYTWHMNLGWRELAFGVVVVGAPWIALVSLFATVASLSTAKNHWKGWSFVALVLLPAISTLCFLWVVSAGWHDTEGDILAFVPVVAALLYPALWWLVAAKGRWTLSISLGLLCGVTLPWIISGIQALEIQDIRLVDQPQASGLTIRRLRSSADTEGMAENQASVSRLLEVRGLGPDEFIAFTSINKLPEGARGPLQSDRNLSEMGMTAFSVNTNGLLIPATASLFHVMGIENTPATPFPVWDDRSSALNVPDLSTFLSLPLSASKDPNRRRETFDSADRTWMMAGSVYRWEKVLETTAKAGGRARIQGGGVVEMQEIDPREPHFEISVRSIRGLFQSHAYEFSIHRPVLIATGKSGVRRFVKCVDMAYGSRTGFLLDVKDFKFRAPLSNSQTYGQVSALENIRLELFWPVYRGSVDVTLPPP